MSLNQHNLRNWQFVESASITSKVTKMHSSGLRVNNLTEQNGVGNVWKIVASRR